MCFFFLYPNSLLYSLYMFVKREKEKKGRQIMPLFFLFF